MKIGYKKSGVENALSVLQGADVAAQRYAQGKRYNDEQAQQQQQYDRRYSLALGEDARQNAAESRASQAFPLEQKAREEALRSHTLANDQQASINQQQAAYQQKQQTEDEYANQVEIDSHRQEQAQEYKRITGKDVPPDYWEKDYQGHKPGDPGWHWTMYDPKSDVPIKVQIGFNKTMSELATLPPDATRAEKIAAARRDAHNAVISEAKQSVLDEVGQHVMPDQPDPKAEPDPSQYVPSKTLKSLQDMAKDPTTSPDEMRKAWETVQKSHAQELAAGEARQLAVEGLDMHAQRLAQQQADYGDIAGKTDPAAFEAFRAMRHRIAESKLSGPALAAAVAAAKDALVPVKPPRDPHNDKTGFNAGEAIKTAAQELATNPQYIQADDATKNAMLQKRAGDYMRMAQGLAGGDMPGASSAQRGPGPNGGYPNTPEAQAQAAAVNAQQQPAKADPASLAPKAKAAGWTKEEFIRFGQTGEQPKGKPPIQ